MDISGQILKKIHVEEGVKESGSVKNVAGLVFPSFHHCSSLFVIL